jgi:2-octaprenyl-6-methoxyphenol hydroxylase
MPTLKSFDIIIIGGGPAGLALAASLPRDLNIALVEPNPIPPQLTVKFDGRTIALAHQGVELLRSAGVWKELQSNANPITEIRTTDRSSPLHLHFDSAEINQGPFGYMVENRHLRAALWRTVQARKSVTVFTANVVDSDLSGHMADVTISDTRKASRGAVAPTAKQGAERTRHLTTQLVVAADGRASPSRARQQIDSFKITYNQQALVCTVEHTLPHNNVALEHFVAEGPLATLPLTGNRSGIVWTAKPETITAMLALDDTSFLELLSANGAGFLGDLRMHTPRMSYPLHLQHAHSYTTPHFVMVGDAAHVMHPIAGQGFNMGLRDVACLVRLITEARARGLRPDDASVLTQYERQRRADNQAMLAATDVLDRLFATNAPLIGPLRRVGLAIVNHSGPLRRFFIRQAMGLEGNTRNAA